MEKEVLGVYVTGHPLAEYGEVLSKKTSIDNGEINKLREEPEKLQELNDQENIIGGMIIGKRMLSTKRN